MIHDRTEWVADIASRFGKMIFTTAYRILGNAQDAEDTLQEVFLKILEPQSRRNSEPMKNEGAYLRVTASHCAVNLLRRRSRWQQIGDELDGTLVNSSDESPHQIATQKQKANQIRQALRIIPERDAQVFVLRYFEDLSYEEITERTGINTNQVGVILHRARQRLQEILLPDIENEKKPATRIQIKEENSHA